MEKRTLLTFTLSIFTIITLIANLAIAEEKSKPPSPKAKQSVNNITQNAVKNGILFCASRINQVTNFLTAGEQNVGYWIFYAPTDADQQMASVSMEIPLKDSSAYASASFAPNQANGCGGMYETVVYWPIKCMEVAEKNFGTLKKTGALSKNISVLDAGESTKIFLMPAGTGCVAIKKEMVQ